MSVKNSIARFCSAPVLTLARRLRSVARGWLSHAQIQKLLKSAAPIKLELGSGSKRGANGWTTLGMVPGCDLYCDLARGIPFPPESVSEIYSSHLFEHLTREQAQQLLRECLRVMVPGGKFSICVPNAKRYLDAYSQKESLDEAQFLAYAPANNRSTRIDYVNYVAYMDGSNARVREVILRSIRSGSMFRVSGLMSARTGVPPA